MAPAWGVDAIVHAAWGFAAETGPRLRLCRVGGLRSGHLARGWVLVQLLLAKKGPLAKVWMAAHWDKKLTKQAIVQTDIRSSAGACSLPGYPDMLSSARPSLPGALQSN